MPRGGKREGAGRKSRGLESGKISAYIQDREILNNLSKELNIPVVEIVHQLIKHKDFENIIKSIKSSEEIKQIYNNKK